MTKFSMAKKYILLFLFFYLNPFYGIDLSFAQSDSMNYFLEKKKAELDPFQNSQKNSQNNVQNNSQNNSQAKIDLESMGLDNVGVGNDGKNNSKINNYQEKSEILVNNTQKTPNKIENNNDNQVIKKVNKNKDLSKLNNNSNLVNEIEYNRQNNPQNTISSTLQDNKYLLSKTAKINNQKKQKLASRLEQESKKMQLASDKNQSIANKDDDTKTVQNPDDWQNQLLEKALSDTINQNNIDSQNNEQNEIVNINSKKMSLAEKKIYEKRRKKILNDLRRMYLGDEKDEKIQRLQQIDDDFAQDEVIIPKEKNLNRFAVEELPAYPILSLNRTEDNFHIPFINTPKQIINLAFQAVREGDILRFKEIYKSVKNPNIQNEYGDTFLTQAILIKNHQLVAEILACGADPDLPNRLGYTPIEIAIELLDFRSLQILVDNYADIKSLDRFGRTYLMHASRVGLLPAVDLFVKKGVDVNAIDKDGFSALSIAYRHKKEVIVQYLLKNNAKQWNERKFIPQSQSLINELQNRWK